MLTIWFFLKKKRERCLRCSGKNKIPNALSYYTKYRSFCWSAWRTPEMKQNTTRTIRTNTPTMKKFICKRIDRQCVPFFNEKKENYNKRLGRRKWFDMKRPFDRWNKKKANKHIRDIRNPKYEIIRYQFLLSWNVYEFIESIQTLHVKQKRTGRTNTHTMHIIINRISLSLFRVGEKNPELHA